MKPRTFDEHTALLCAFAERVEALSPAEWERVSIRCRPLCGAHPEALFLRAQLSVVPYDRFPDMRAAPALIRAIPAVFRASVLAQALVLEGITLAFPSTIQPPRTPRGGFSRPAFEDVAKAKSLIERTMQQHGVRIPGIATAVRAAAHAVWSHDHLAAPVFRRAYQWIEPEIPYALVDSAIYPVPSTGTGSYQP